MLLMEPIVAFCAFQLSVMFWPCWVITVGEALMTQVGAGGGSAVTITDARQFTEPPGPVKVPVIVSDCGGQMVIEPEEDTEPI